MAFERTVLKHLLHQVWTTEQLIMDQDKWFSKKAHRFHKFSFTMRRQQKWRQASSAFVPCHTTKKSLRFHNLSSQRYAHLLTAECCVHLNAVTMMQLGNDRICWGWELGGAVPDSVFCQSNPIWLLNMTVCFFFFQAHIKLLSQLTWVSRFTGKRLCPYSFLVWQKNAGEALLQWEGKMAAQGGCFSW